MIELGSAVGYLLLDTTQFKKGFSSALNDLKTFTDKTTTVSDKVQALESSFKGLGTNLTKYVTLPVVGAGTAIMALGNDFEAQMSRVQAIAGATGEELEQLKDLAIQLGADTSFSASQVAEAMENLASAGFTTAEIMEAIPGLLDLAAASGADLATASEIAASSIRGFGLEASEAGHVADVLAEAAARTNAQVEDMGDAMKYVAPVANAMGLSLEETAAAIGIMSDAGIKGSQAGTSLRGALSRLAKPTEAMEKTMDRLGLSFYDAEGNMVSLEEMVTRLQDSFEGLTQEERNNALVTLFGQESLSGMLALIQRGPDELAALTEGFENADGAAQEMADVMLDNTAGAIEELTGSIETLAIKFQEVMAPTVKDIVNRLTEFVNWLSSADEDTLKLIATIAGVAAVIGPVLIILSSLITAITTIGSVIMALLNPITLVIAAVAAFALAWETNFLGVRDLVTGFITWFDETFNEFCENLVETISAVLGTIFDAIVNAFVWIAETIQGAATTISNAVVWLINAAWDAAKGVWNLITVWIPQQIQNVVNIVLGFVQAFYDAGVSIFTGLWNGLKSVWDSIVGWVNDCISWINDKLDEWFSAADQMEGGDEKPSRSGGSHASGLDYVPYDGYRATLHQGEAVLTKNENEQRNQPSGNTFVFNSPEPIDEVKAAQEFKRVQKELAKGL